jgi:hypothetical protein
MARTCFQPNDSSHANKLLHPNKKDVDDLAFFLLQGSVCFFIRHNKVHHIFWLGTVTTVR